MEAMREILVVDDDAHLARTVSDILQLNGYDAITAGSGQETLDLISRTDGGFPVALIDLKLPDMNGLELVRTFQERRLLTEVVVLTGNASFDSAVAALRDRSFDYLVKPVAPKRLLETVRRGLRLWHHHSAEDRLRQDRHRFQQVVESLSDIVLVLTSDRRIEYLSPSSGGVLGYEPGELTGEPLLPLVREGDRMVVAEALDQAGREAGGGATFEFLLRRSDGEMRRFEAVARSLRAATSDGSVVLTCRDVTERRQLEKELLQSQKLESIGRLAGGVAHDFNNQLTAILSAVDLASWAEDVPPEVHGELGEIRFAAHRAARLTRQLLIFSRKDRAEPRHIAVNEIVEAMLNMLRRLIPEDIVIRTELQPGLPPVFVDRTQIEQVLLNLVVNARDAMRDGGEITIRTSPEDHIAGEEDGESPPWIRLEVTDTGTGMTEEVRSRIFEPFFTTKEQGRGTGLGLATCYGIVKRAGGHIQVTTQPGDGSTFHVLLPGGVETDVGDSEQDEAEPIRPREGGRETLLLVEDEDGVRRVLERILSSKGYRVLTAEGGVRGLALAEAHQGPIDLLISDLVMPEMKGPELAGGVLGLRPETRVLFISGYADRDVVDILDRFPSAELLEKPITAPEILAAVREILDRDS